jgi:hypothetical protein
MPCRGSAASAVKHTGYYFVFGICTGQCGLMQLQHGLGLAHIQARKPKDHLPC